MIKRLVAWLRIWLLTPLEPKLIPSFNLPNIQIAKLSDYLKLFGRSSN